MKIDFNAENYVICACYGLYGDTAPPNTMGELCVLTVNVQGAGEIERRRGREGEQEAKDLQVAYLHKPKQTHAHTFCSRYCVYPVTMEMYVK